MARPNVPCCVMNGLSASIARNQNLRDRGSESSHCRPARENQRSLFFPDGQEVRCHEVAREPHRQFDCLCAPPSSNWKEFNDLKSGEAQPSAQTSCAGLLNTRLTEVSEVVIFPLAAPFALPERQAPHVGHANDDFAASPD